MDEVLAKALNQTDATDVWFCVKPLWTRCMVNDAWSYTSLCRRSVLSVILMGKGILMRLAKCHDLNSQHDAEKETRTQLQLS